MLTLKFRSSKVILAAVSLSMAASAAQAGLFYIQSPSQDESLQMAFGTSRNGVIYGVTSAVGYSGGYFWTQSQGVTLLPGLSGRDAYNPLHSSSNGTVFGGWALYPNQEQDAEGILWENGNTPTVTGLYAIDALSPSGAIAYGQEGGVVNGIPELSSAIWTKANGLQPFVLGPGLLVQNASDELGKLVAVSFQTMGHVYIDHSAGDSIPLPGGFKATGISDDGLTVYGYSGGKVATWTKAGGVVTTDLGFQIVKATHHNNGQNFAGVALDSNTNKNRRFFYRPDIGFMWMDDYLLANGVVLPAGTGLDYISFSDDFTVITGFQESNPPNYTSVLVAVVPEPGSIVVLASGMLMTAGLIRRRK